MSLDASGSVASTITFSKWKGRNYVRQLTIPSNPSTSGQQNARLSLGSLGKAAHLILTSTVDVAHFGSLFFQIARDQAPSGQSWISFLQGAMASILIGAVETAWTALGGTKQGYFTSAAGTAGMVDYAPLFYTGTDSIAGLKGFQLFALAYFASHSTTGALKTDADLAIAGASLTPVTDFAQDCSESNN